MSVFRQRPIQPAFKRQRLLEDAAPAPPPPPPPDPVTAMATVLQFDASKNHHVNHGVVWPINTDLPRTWFWDAWVCPDANGGYIISEGYGGLHSLLFGLSGIAASPYNCLTGNVWDGTNPPLSFGSDDGPAAGEWCHVAVGAEQGNRIVCYVNGVPSGMVLYNAAHRYAQQGTLFVGGSGHLNLGGKLAMLRGFEGTNPLLGEFDAANRMMIAFRPETRFAAEARQRITGNPLVRANFLADYTQPATVIADHSIGNYGARHPGQLWGTNGVGDGAINAGFGANVVACRYPLPRFVPDPTAPTSQFDAAPTVPLSAPLTPPTTPPGALVFDSHSRADSTFCFEGSPTLGSTEGGSLGPKVWQYNAPDSPDGKGDAEFKWGILKGRAVALGVGFQVAFVKCGTANHDVRVDRRGYPAAYSDGRTGLTFRLRDGNNFWYVTSDGTKPDAQTIRWGVYENKQRTNVGSATAPASWTTLRAAATGSQIAIYCDAQQIASFTDGRFASEDGTGLFMSDFGNGFSGVARYDNFTVLSA